MYVDDSFVNRFFFTDGGQMDNAYKKTLPKGTAQAIATAWNGLNLVTMYLKLGIESVSEELLLVPDEVILSYFLGGEFTSSMFMNFTHPSISKYERFIRLMSIGGVVPPAELISAIHDFLEQYLVDQGVIGIVLTTRPTHTECHPVRIETRHVPYNSEEVPFVDLSNLFPKSNEPTRKSRYE